MRKDKNMPRKSRLVATLSGAAAGGILALTIGGSLVASPLASVLATVVGSAGASSAHNNDNHDNGNHGSNHNDATPAQGETAHQNQGQNVDNQPWSVTTFTNAEGQFCIGEKVPGGGGEAGQGMTCRNPETLFAESPLFYVVGSRQIPPHLKHWDNAWVWGLASENVARVEVQLTDCSTVPLSINDNRVFSRVFSAATIKKGVGPQQLIAYDAAGAVIESAATPLEAPSSTPAKLVGATAPERSAC